MSLLDIIKSQIALNGPMNLAVFTDLCLSHPTYGYYMRKDPFGVQGDFITAPEISQLFGEMIGVWVADMWQQLGGPDKIILCEIGGGRGTLMRDILRVCDKVPELKSAVAVHMVDTSEILIAAQREKLQGFDVAWHKNIDTVPNDRPIIIIGNEFMDALPIRQAIFIKGDWHERVVGLGDNDALALGIGGTLMADDLPYGQDGDIYEFSIPREQVWRDMCGRIDAQNGACLMIDYGHFSVSKGDTLQAIKNHQFADITDAVGECDITSHVDFKKLYDIVGSEFPDLKIYGPVTQSEFLTSFGINLRAEKLAAMNENRRDDIISGFRRLVDKNQMGQLFKVIYVSRTD